MINENIIEQSELVSEPKMQNQEKPTDFNHLFIIQENNNEYENASSSVSSSDDINKTQPQLINEHLNIKEILNNVIILPKLEDDILTDEVKIILQTNKPDNDNDLKNYSTPISVLKSNQPRVTNQSLLRAKLIRKRK